MLTPYILQLTVFCSIIDRLRSFTPGQIARIYQRSAGHTLLT